MTSEDIRELSLVSLPDSIFLNQEAIDQTIANAKQSIETYLNKKLDPTEYREYPEWERLGDKYKAVLSVTPIIVCEGAEFIGKAFVVFDDTPETVDYTAGFEVIPGDIKRVWFNLAMYEINRSRDNSFNFSTKTVLSGSTTSDISKAPDDFYNDELKRLFKHKDKKMYGVFYEPGSEAE
jgi:hypothetical protein